MNISSNPTTEVNRYIYYIFSFKHKWGDFGETSDIKSRSLSHLKKASKFSSQFLYPKLRSIGIERFGMIYVRIPSFLRKFSGAMLNRFFRPTLKTKVPSLYAAQSKMSYPLKKSIKDLSILKSFVASKVDQQRTRPLVKLSRIHSSTAAELSITVYHNLFQKRCPPISGTLYGF